MGPLGYVACVAIRSLFGVGRMWLDSSGYSFFFPVNAVLDKCPQIRCCLDDASSEDLKEVERMQLGEAVKCWFCLGRTRVMVNGG